MADSHDYDVELEGATSSAEEDTGITVLDIEDGVEMQDALAGIFYQIPIELRNDLDHKAVKKDSARYFESHAASDDNSIVCYACGGAGHVSASCPVMINRHCVYCGDKHPSNTCVNQFCERCQCLGHRDKFCKTRKKTKVGCARCPKQGHSQDECPKRWRRYKLKNTNARQNLFMSCPYCYSKKHFSDDCELKEVKISIFTKKYRNILGI